MTDQTTLAYLAGMIDGDGYISITRSVRNGNEYFGPQVGIAGTRREPHDLAASIWGGVVSTYKPDCTHALRGKTVDLPTWTEVGT